MANNSGMISTCRLITGPNFHYERDEIARILVTHDQQSRINTPGRLDNCIPVCIASCVGYRGVPVDRLQQQADTYVLSGGCTFPRQFLFLCSRLQRLGIWLEEVLVDDVLNGNVRFTGSYSTICIFEKGYINTNSRDRKKASAVQHAVVYSGHSQSGPTYKDFQFSKKGSAGQEPLDRTEYLKGWTLIAAVRVESSRYDERRGPLDNALKGVEMRMLRSWDQQDSDNPRPDWREDVISYFNLTGKLLPAQGRHL